jgi:hypothetical protein
MTAQIPLPSGPTLVAECEPGRDAAAADLLRAVARRDAAGPALRPGAIVDVGWAPLQVRAEDAQTWQLCEPVYGAEPMDWRRGLDITLAVLDRQAALMRTLDLAPLATRCDQWLLLAPGVLQAPSAFLERNRPAAPGDSGWYIGVHGGTAPPDRRLAERTTAGRLALQRPAWLAVLALPPGCMAFYRRDLLDSIVDADDRQIFPGPGHG